jgi:formiminoglutamate deiminase
VTQFWCERAWLGASDVRRGVLIDVAGERIESVETGVANPPAGAETLRGFVIPGLANAHSHAFQRALRGRTQRAGRGSFWTWREQMYALATAVDPDSMRALARATYAEMVLAGITVVGEFHYVHHRADGTPYDDPNAMGLAVIEGAREAGLRITLIDACYLHGGINRAPDAGQRRFCDPDVDAWVQRVDALPEATHARVGAAIHSIRAVDPESAAVVARWARERRAPLHAHVSEQPAENEACRAAYGDSPIGVLNQAGAITAGFTAIHATHVTAEDTATLGGAGAFCCLCPTTERDLADGVGPAAQLRDDGAVLALGSDSHAVIEPLEEARAVELDERLVSGERGRHAADDLLYAASAGGYASVGWPEGGMLRAGALADLVAFDLGSVRLAGLRDSELVDGLVFAGTSADVGDVVVGGRFVVRDGQHMALDVPRVLETTIDGVTS